MNCEDFNDSLHEYLDGSLPAALQAQAREHLRQCDHCRHALRREQALSQNLRDGLDRATVRLTLRPGTFPNLLRELESAQTTPNPLTRAWQWFIASSTRPLAATALLLLALSLLLLLPRLRHPAQNPAPIAAAGSPRQWVIDVPLQIQTHVFRRQDDAVIDTVTPSLALAHATFPETKR